ncbi:MAPEG family protein [Sphingomonas suaedae]|uniref:MAPEG family protein n=1 Tax=Sphingomonas suaedae TaxID=2599297 RepID=A0A518RIP0_9SPHN|nr:MAPEG family protein [Sphingomonas suaedae]QDX27303.1 MAPEG family protein [Sphingomonas suaedae]
MDAIILPVTLAATAACALINVWLAVRIGNVRRAEKISIGDGGNARLIARMRAQLNFAEYAPIVLILIGLIELAIGTESWLWAVAGAFVLARILHPIGMDGWGPGRMVGIAVTLLVTIGLAGYAASIPLLSADEVETILVE